MNTWLPDFKIRRDSDRANQFKCESDHDGFIISSVILRISINGCIEKAAFSLQAYCKVRPTFNVGWRNRYIDELL